MTALIICAIVILVLACAVSWGCGYVAGVQDTKRRTAKAARHPSVTRIDMGPYS